MFLFYSGQTDDLIHPGAALQSHRASRLTEVSYKAKHACPSSGLSNHNYEIIRHMGALKFANTVTKLRGQQKAINHVIVVGNLL